MNDANSSKSIRWLRNASLCTFWLGVFAIVFFSPFNILNRTNINDTAWFVAPFVAAAVAVLAIIVYLIALELGQGEARDGFVAVLTGEAARDRPIILVLLPFDFAESGPIERAFGQFVSGISVVALFFGAAVRPVTAPPTLPYSYGAFEQELGSALARAIHDAVDELDDAIASQALLVTIGNRCVSCGSDEFGLNDKDGPETFRRLAEAAELIVLLPDQSPAVLWELSQTLPSRALLEKTVFIMPRGGSARRWAALAEYATDKLGATLPRHDGNGCCFRLTSDRQPGETVALESFNRGLQSYLESATTGAFSVAELWKSVKMFPVESPAVPQTAPDWARRVTATGYVDDGEALIKQLGGTVAYQVSGEVFTSTKITVRVFGVEHSFESQYDMVQWIIKDVVPRVMSGPANPAGGIATSRSRP
jgi:hypothetical protein